MKPLSKAKINRIIDLVFSGNTFRETARKVDVSPSSIHKYLEEFIGATEESSIREAAAKYNVEDVVDHLLELAQEGKKTKVSLQNLLSASRLYRFMKARNLKPSQLKSFLKMCDKHNHDFPDFASKTTEFYQLEERTGKTYAELPIELSAMAKKRTKMKDKITTLRGETAELKKERKQAEDDLKRELKISNLVRKEIPYASTLKETLTEYDYTVEDTSKIPKLLKEIEACGGNAKVFLERTEEAKDLKWEILNLKDEKKRSEPVVESIKQEGLKLQEKRDELQGQVKSLQETRQKLQKEIETLDREASRKSNDLGLASCLTSILMSKPADINALHNYACQLKQIAAGLVPELLPHKPLYEKAVKKLIVNTLVEYLKEELATREEVNKLKEKDQQNSILLTKAIKLKEAYGKLLRENTKLTKKVELLEEEVRKCTERLLRDPTIPPEHK